MRISDWSSDVCSSDLSFEGFLAFVCYDEEAEFDVDAISVSVTIALECFMTCGRSEEHTSELQSLMRISYAVFCLKKKKYHKIIYSISEINYNEVTMHNNNYISKKKNTKYNTEY